MKKEKQRKKENTYTAYRKDSQLTSSFTLVRASYLALGKEWKTSFLLFLQIRRTRLQYFQPLGAPSLPSVQLPRGHVQTSLPWCQSRIRHIACHLKPEHDGSQACLLQIFQTSESLCSQWKEEGHFGSVHFAQILPNLLLKKRKREVY